MKYLIFLLLPLLLVGCSIGAKSWGTSGSADAFKFTITESQTGSITPELVAGGGAYSMVFQKPYLEGEKFPAMMAFSRRQSMWGWISGNSGSGNISFVYVAGSEEKPEDTALILEKLAELANPNAVPKPKKE